MKQFVSCARVLAHKALIINCFMSGAPSYEIKAEPQSGVGCEADAFMNMGAELLPPVIHQVTTGNGCAPPPGSATVLLFPGS